MRSEIRGVLLIPAEGDPLGLLRDGPCGTRPPFAWRKRQRWQDGSMQLVGPWLSGGLYGCVTPRPGDALVLAWDGELVTEGCNILAEAIAWARPYRRAREIVRDILRGNLRHRKPLVSKGAVALLDADGLEVSRVHG